MRSPVRNILLLLDKRTSICPKVSLPTFQQVGCGAPAIGGAHLLPTQNVRRPA
jgi:hypothetical protein